MPRKIDQFGRKRCQKKRKNMNYKLLYESAVKTSLSTYVCYARTVYFGWICRRRWNHVILEESKGPKKTRVQLRTEIATQPWIHFTTLAFKWKMPWTKKRLFDARNNIMAEDVWSYYTIHNNRISSLNRSSFLQFLTNLSEILKIGKVCWYLW